MGPRWFRLLIISLSLSFLFLLAGCQAVSPRSAVSATPTPAPSPASFKQPKFLFAAGEGGSTGIYQVFTVNAATGELRPLGPNAFDEGVPKEIQYDAGSSSLFVSVGESELMNVPGLHTFHFDPVAGILTSTGSIDSLGDWSSAATSDGKALYVNGFQHLSRYLIDKNSGALIPTSSSYATDSLGQWMLKMHPSGKFLYGNGLFPLNPPGPNGSNAIYHLIGFVIDPSTGAPVPIAGFPRQEAMNGGITIHPSGNFIIAAGVNLIYSYQLDQTSGAAQLAGSATFDGRNFPDLVPVIEPGGRYVYLCCAHGQLFAFRFDSSNGQLAALPSFPMNVTSPDRDPETPIAVSGSYLFLGQGKSLTPDIPSIAVFKIQDDGSLTPVPGSPFKSSFGVVKALAVAEE
jgi:hypothetical protein